MTGSPPFAVTVERDEVSAPFFDAAANGVLLIRRCPSCHHSYAPQVRWCPACDSAVLEWTPATGTGRLVSWGIVHARADGAAPAVVLGLVELDEGPWLHSRLRVADPEHLRSGTPMQVGFHHPEDGEPIPVFDAVEGKRT